MGIKVLSLFDGISCAKVALERAGFVIDTYIAYEIDKNAIEISKKNHPSIIHKGSVKEMKEAVDVDILIGGSPCQDLSSANNGRKGLAGEKSSLFWEYIRIKNLCNPKWFILENVASMAKETKDIISSAMGVQPIMFNASLVSAQHRKRFFWTNIPFVLPTDRNIHLKDILETNTDIKYHIQQPYIKYDEPQSNILGYLESGKKNGNHISQGYRIYSINNKSLAVCAKGGGIGAQTGLYKTHENFIGAQTVYKTDVIRRLTPRECERLQGLPDDYTIGISDNQRYKCCGNAFNVDVISTIVKNMVV